MNKLLEWLRLWWPRIPADIRYTIMLGAVSVITVFATLAWRDGYRPVGMDHYLTRDVSQGQIDVLKANIEEGRAQAIVDALSQYDGNIKQYLKEERMLGMDTLIRPAIKMLFEIDRRMKQVERGMKITNAKVDQMPSVYEERLRNLIMDNDQQDRTTVLLEQLMYRMEAQDEANVKMQEAIEQLRPKRVSKQKF